MMKSFYTPARIFALVLLVLGLAPQYSLAQTVSVSPGDLSFGVPTGTPSPFASAPDNVLVNITGEGSRTFSVTVGGTNAGDFVIDGNSCTGAITAPNTCQVTLHFKASPGLLGTLETAALHISASGLDDFVVPMNGAYGAIKLFSALDVNNSLFPLSFPGQAVKTATLNLSCPVNGTITAKLSSTPDGLSNVFQDNYIQVVNTAVGHDPTTTQNVCYGGDPTGWAGGTLPPGTSNCFKLAYEGAAGGFIGQNPDLAGLPANYGVQPLDLQNPPSFGDSGPPFAPVLVSGAQALSVQLFDGGGLLGASTVHLVTNCTVAGVVPGSSITGDPIVPNVPQTFAFDNAPGENISLTSTNTGTGAVPIVTNIGIPQSLFSQLVTGTPAAPAVCLRMTGELDSLKQAMCKGFLIQCYDPIAKTTTGDNCVPTASDARTLLDQAQFASPDGPSGVNYLGTACDFFTGGTNSCVASNLSGGTPTLIGPGLLLGSDNWVCRPGSPNTSPCTPVEANTGDTGTFYSAANCSLTGVLTNFLCPLDTLTQFKGAADPLSGSTTTGKNSIFIPVVNMPLPFTQTAITGQNANGWVHSSPFSVSFTANQATYPGTAPNNPAKNDFQAAPPYSVTYGIAPLATPLPDTTYPVPTDAVQYPGNTTVFHNTDPLQPPPAIANCNSLHNPFFTANDSFSEAEGIYNLHNFTTDCAFTEGLLFNPTTPQLSDPTANWASFQVTSVGVDLVAPILACTVSPAPNGTNGWYKTTNVSASCSATDDYSGFAPGSAVLGTNPPVFQGSLTTKFGPVFSVVPGSGPANAAIPQQVIQDLAGNSSNTQGSYPTPIDTTLPTVAATFSAPGNTFTVGQSGVSINYACHDTGSGVASCPGLPVPPACPTAPSAGPLTFNSSAPIDTSAAQLGPHTFNVNSTDCAGNISSPATPVSYTIAAPPADLWLFEIPLASDSIKRGTTGSFYAAVINLSSPTAYNVVITTTFPAPPSGVLGSVSAGYALVTCKLTGCTTLPNSTTPCGVSGTTITCTVPLLPSVATSKYGVVVKVSIPVLATAPLKAFTSVSTVTSANDPKSSNNSHTEHYTVSK
jgi:hypothetical protein